VTQKLLPRYYSGVFEKLLPVGESLKMNIITQLYVAATSQQHFFFQKSLPKPKENISLTCTS
jgi:hypothetical protein